MPTDYYVERDQDGNIVTLRLNPVKDVELERLSENHKDVKAYRVRLDHLREPKVDILGLMLTGWAIGRGLVNPETDAKVINQYNNDMQALWDKRQKG